MPTVSISLRHKTTKPNQTDICIIGGCGHVGLPLGLAFADQGKQVVLYDINDLGIEKVNNKIMPFMEEGADKILDKVVNQKKLYATRQTSVIAESANLIMVIGTPVDEHLNPKLHDVIKAIKEVEEHLKDDHLLILRSTLFPGATSKIIHYLRSKGLETDVAFCPERIAEGKALTELYSLPQIVSGSSPKAIARARELFSALTTEIIELEPIEAELAKLYTNTWRYINFAISNQFFMIANDHSLDFYKIHNAMTKDYPRLKSFARAGFAAGPCLFKDTMQLSSFAANSFFLGHSAMLINENLPDYVVEEMKNNMDLSDKVIGILGMAFKAENDDPRESLSYKLKKKLELEAKEVLCTDPYVKDDRLVSIDIVKKRADAIIVATPHNEYSELNFGKKPVIDIWNLYEKGSLI